MLTFSTSITTVKHINTSRCKCISGDLLSAYQCYHATWFSSIILVNSRCCLTIFSNCPDPLPHDKIYQIHSMQQSTYKGAAYHLWRRQLNLNSIIRIITKSNCWMHHTPQHYLTVIIGREGGEGIISQIKSFNNLLLLFNSSSLPPIRMVMSVMCQKNDFHVSEVRWCAIPVWGDSWLVGQAIHLIPCPYSAHIRITSWAIDGSVGGGSCGR